MKELLSDNPQLIEPSLTTLINRCVTLISDEVSENFSRLASYTKLCDVQDAMVRKSLLGFLSWLLPIIPTVSELIQLHNHHG